MAGKKEIEARTEALLAPIVAERGVRVYDVEYVKEGADWYLRAYIDKDGGVNIEDCEAVSRALSARLDEEDAAGGWIDGSYTLEVSSPGLGRQLRKDRHMDYSIGEEVELKLYEAQDGQKEYEGTLQGYDKDSVTLLIDGKARPFERKKISVLRLKVDL